MDDEHVAALHDGRLGERERDELLSQLLANDDDLDDFAETAAVLREIEEAHGAAPPVTGGNESDGVIPLSAHRPPAPSAAVDVDDGAPEDPGNGVIPIRSRRAPGRRWMTYGSIAASIVGIGLAAALWRQSRSAFDDPVSAVAMLEGGAARGPAEGWNREPWRGPATRGPEPKVAFEPLAVRSGVYLVNLELADAARDTATVRSLAREMEAQLDSAPGARSIADLYGRAKETGPDSVRPLLAQGREAVRTYLHSEWLELGVWAETGRTAAVRRDAAFFRKGRTRRVLDRLATSPEFDKETVEALRTVHAAIPTKGTVDMPEMEKRLTKLLGKAGRERLPDQ